MNRFGCIVFKIVCVYTHINLLKNGYSLPTLFIKTFIYFIDELSVSGQLICFITQKVNSKVGSDDFQTNIKTSRSDR